MRNAVLAAVVLSLSCGDDASDQGLRVNEIQALGTHNSYHQLVGAPADPALDYVHAPLGEQLDLGVRHFEIDVHRDPTGAGVPGTEIAVYHIRYLDEASSCPTLAACLGAIRAWSDAHPRHHLLFVLIEPKDDLARVAVELGKDPALTGELPWDGHVADIDAVIRASWPDRLLTPAHLRGSFPTLRQALSTQGWPTIDDTRQQLAIVLNDTASLRAEYRQVASPQCFVFGEPTEDDAAFFKADDARADPAGLAAALRAGLIARSRADGDTTVDPAETAAALLSGAQLISTDYAIARSDGAHPGYRVPWPGTPEHPSRCNPVTAPADCRLVDIE